jgi:hypothetical protein
MKNLCRNMTVVSGNQNAMGCKIQVSGQGRLLFKLSQKKTTRKRGNVKN